MKAGLAEADVGHALVFLAFGEPLIDAADASWFGSYNDLGEIFFV